jgi:hypothetical protein
MGGKKSPNFRCCKDVLVAPRWCGRWCPSVGALVTPWQRWWLLRAVILRLSVLTVPWWHSREWLARAFASDVVVVLLVTIVQWLPNCASAVGLVAPAISLLCRDDEDEDSSLLRTMLMRLSRHFLLEGDIWHLRCGPQLLLRTISDLVVASRCLALVVSVRVPPFFFFLLIFLKKNRRRRRRRKGEGRAH